MLRYYLDYKKDKCSKCDVITLVIPKDCNIHFCCVECYEQNCFLCKKEYRKVYKEKPLYNYNYGTT
jgi:hypothetical protein